MCDRRYDGRAGSSCARYFNFVKNAQHDKEMTQRALFELGLLALQEVKEDNVYLLPPNLGVYE